MAIRSPVKFSPLLFQRESKTSVLEDSFFQFAESEFSKCDGGLKKISECILLYGRFFFTES